MAHRKFIAGFLPLSLYLHLLPPLVRGQDGLWLAVFLLFFPLVHFTGKWSSGAGITRLGLGVKGPWKKQFGYGLLIGGAVWTGLTLSELLLGSLQFRGWQPLGNLPWLLVQSAVVALLGSAANDLLTRGYVFAHWGRRLPVLTVVLLSAALYATDDIWLEGLNWRNTVFSLLLGLAFALSVVRTGALWMNTGLHAGLNFIYYLTYGFKGGSAHYGVFLSESKPDVWPAYGGIAAAAIVLTLTLLPAVPGQKGRGAPALRKKRSPALSGR